MGLEPTTTRLKGEVTLFYTTPNVYKVGNRRKECLATAALPVKLQAVIFMVGPLGFEPRSAVPNEVSLYYTTTNFERSEY